MTAAWAVTAGIAALLALSWRWRPRGRVEVGLRLLAGAYLVLGAVALIDTWFLPAAAAPGPFELAKPTILYWTLCLILVVSPRMHWGHPAKAIVGTYFVFSPSEWTWINRALALLCAILGGLNLYIAATASVGEWEGFKFACMVNLVAIFLLRLTYHWIDTLVRIARHLHAMRSRKP